MLNAEHVALESRLVSQMVSIRQREMDVLLERYTAIGTQASLLAGFAISQLGSLNPSDPDVSEPITYLFYTTSLVCVLSSMHVVMCTMYVCNWAPRLALRGPSGSISRAYGATRSEKHQINLVFTTGTISFAMQTALAVWVMDKSRTVSPHALYATAAVFVLVFYDLYYHRRMYHRFFGKSGEWTVGAARRNRTAAPKTQCTVLNNPLANVDVNPDAVDSEILSQTGATARRGEPAEPRESEVNHAGLLVKRSLKPGEPGAAAWRASSIGRLANSVAGEWRERYFVLRDGTLNYWRSQAEYEAGKPAALEEAIDLAGHEVLVDTDSPKWAFTITPILADGRRAWHLRAQSDRDRLTWARKLVFNTFIRDQ